MDQSTRNTLRNVVTQCRKLLEESVAQVLQGQFGIYAAGKKDEVQIEPEARMSHLSEEDRAYRQDLLDHYEHIKALGYKAKDALAQLIREVAFTHLNRFCAYRMMESRGLIRESVSKGLKSQGFLFYLADHEEDERRFNTGQQDVAYRHFLNWLGGTLSEEIGVLFAPTDPANRLYPPQRVIDQVLGLLNDPELAGIWSEDEAIGWVYQYFTPKELRDQARKESGAPRDSYELAFRNQFFTPRYVVKFLTDNTLGRIWYEMRQGNTRLKDQCLYMVRRPTEVFLKDGEAEPKDAAKATDDLSQQELLKLPVYVPFRAKKDPREIRIIDPACGSGHFLLYCFDLLLTIYEEAFGDPDLGPSLKKDYPTLEDLRRDVPRLILAHNLHGIDIDPRASQIAALALWLRCQRAYQEMGIKQDRPKITRSNIVCAEPMPGEAQMLSEFTNTIAPPLLGQIVHNAFEQMRLAGVAGSLLKIELEVRKSIAQAKAMWSAEHERAVGQDKALLLFTRAEMNRAVAKEPPKTFEVSSITDEQFWEEAEDRVVAALDEYAASATGSGRFARRLFAEDASQGFAFVDLCRTRFDVVLMNPPFGEVSIPSRSYLYEAYDNASQDIFSAFVDRGIEMLTDGGLLGALTSRLGFFLELLEDWRKRLLGEAACLQLVADLGYGVLDEALVEAAAYVVCNTTTMTSPALFIGLLDSENKPAVLHAQCLSLQQGTSVKVFPADIRSFAGIPASRTAYWVSQRWRDCFTTASTLTTEYGFPYVGLQTGDDDRLLRLHWEVPTAELVTTPPRWVSFAKGGEYSPFYGDYHLVVDWSQRSSARRMSNADAYFRHGVTYTERTTSNLSARVLPPGCVFSPNGVTITPDSSRVMECVVLLNTRIAQFLIEMCVGSGDAVYSGSAARHYGPRILAGLPSPKLGPDHRQAVEESAYKIWRAMQFHQASHEPDRYFVSPFVLTGVPSSLAQWAEREQALRDASFVEIIHQHRLAEHLFEEAFGLTPHDKSDLDAECGIHPDVFERRTPTDIERHAIADAYTQTIESLIDREVQASGPSRALTKKTYIADRRLELLANSFGMHPEVITTVRREKGVLPAGEMRDSAARVVSYIVGLSFGRWSYEIAKNVTPDQLPQPHEPIPPSPLGASPSEHRSLIADNPDSHDDLLRSARIHIETIWNAQAEEIEKDIASHLGVESLRDYFRKPGKGGFWDDHISRYSKSRRKAPIYWLLQSSKKNYAIWLYYHCLDKDILFKAVVNYVEPKIRLEADRLGSLRAQKGEGGKASKKLDKEIEKQEEFLSELRDFEEKLRRAAELHLVPDLNDGVVLNIAPLHELVPWKEAEKYWEELLEGKYEWSSIGKQLREKGLVK
jgi:hypothetical protein